jgi:hypothetical protein
LLVNSKQRSGSAHLSGCDHAVSTLCVLVNIYHAAIIMSRTSIMHL